MSKLLSTAEYAEKHGKSPRVVRQKILDGTLPAKMIGGRYAIKEDEPYIDARITSGKYVGASRSKPAGKREAAHPLAEYTHKITPFNLQ